MPDLSRKRARVSCSARERDLVARANAGDVSALAAIYADHSGWVLALATRFTRDRDDAFDVVQDVFEYLFSRFPGFELTAPLRAFLYPAVKHKSIGVLRRRGRSVSIAAAEGAVTSGRAAELGLDFDRLTRRLPESQRDVVVLRFGAGLGLSEIADALDIPVGTVKSRLHTALRVLRGEVLRAAA